MPAYDRSARETLHLAHQTDLTTHAPWAVFDPDWYRTRYPEAPDVRGDLLLEWYLTRGQVLGHSPNRYFDEAWQRRTWVGIMGLIEANAVASAFDAWCRGAHANRTPHWLFDPREYLTRYPSLTEEALAESGLINLYDHYLRFGAAECRVGHAMLQPMTYLAALDPDEREAAEPMPFAYYLRGLDRRARERRTSILFDLDWYRGRYPEAARSVDAGQYRSLLEHYLCNETPGEFDPSPWFSEAHYLATNPGLADSIGPNGFRNGHAHFLAFGLREGRSPHPDLDLAWYASDEGVQADIEAGLAPDALTHWITIGHPAARPGRPPPTIVTTEAQAVMLSRQKADTIWPLYGRRKLDFSRGETPTVSVIMAVRNQFAETMISLASLRAQFRGEIDLILIVTDPAHGEDIETVVTGASVFRFGIPLNDAAAREAGLVCASAGTVLFLGDGVELAPGAMDAALERLHSEPSIGAVGARLVQPHGALLEAGGIVWRNGQLQAYMRDESPLAPEANFVRDTDFCSTLFLLARRDVLASLPDQAAGIAGTPHDPADLCARIHEAGFRVVYEPDALAFLTHQPDAPVEEGQLAFVAAHPGYLESRPDFAAAAVVGMRTPFQGQTRVLFIEDTVPLRRIGSGFVRSNDVLRAMVASGAAVTVFPMTASGFSLSSIRAEIPGRVEVMHDRSIADLPAFLAARWDCYDVIWVARTHNLGLINETLTSFIEQSSTRPRIVVDTEAVASVRLAGQAALLDQSFDMEAALRHEFRDLRLASHVIAVTEAEADIIRWHYPGPVSVLGHGLAAAPMTRPFEERSGILFVGAIHGMDHPNYDGLAWFIEEVLPLIERRLRWETRLTVVGYTAPDVTLDRFRGHPRVTLRGAVTDLAPLYDAHRVFIAPARFAAGLPYKVHEAAAFGLPVVATGLLANQLGWRDAEEIGAADMKDPAGFAARVIALHRDAALWGRVREAALTRVAADLGPEAFVARVSGLLRADEEVVPDHFETQASEDAPSVDPTEMPVVDFGGVQEPGPVEDSSQHSEVGMAPAPDLVPDGSREPDAGRSDLGADSGATLAPDPDVGGHAISTGPRDPDASGFPDVDVGPVRDPGQDTTTIDRPVPEV